MKNILTTFKNLLFIQTFVLLSFFFSPPKAGADSNVIDVKLENPLQAQNFGDLVSALMNVIIQLGVPVIAILIMYSGFKFVEAQGKPAKIEEAKKSLWYVLIGTAVVLGAGTILAIIKTTVNGLGTV